jgi:hypothetical protein
VSGSAREQAGRQLLVALLLRAAAIRNAAAFQTEVKMFLLRDLFSHPLQLLPPSRAGEGWGGGRRAHAHHESTEVDADLRAYTRSFAMPMVAFAALSTLVALGAWLAELA